MDQNYFINSEIMFDLKLQNYLKILYQTVRQNDLKLLVPIIFISNI